MLVKKLHFTVSEKLQMVHFYPSNITNKLNFYFFSNNSYSFLIIILTNKKITKDKQSINNIKKYIMKMITNLFSIFDPSRASLNLNWIILMVPPIVTSISIKKSSKALSIILIVKTLITKELKSMIRKREESTSNSKIFSLFLVIAILNRTSLLPFNFTITSQISFNLPIALSLWIRYLILGWSKKCKNILAHLVPIGTPNLLLPVIVLIEATRQIIRPITLSVRLTANIVAGHLLISLLGEFSLKSSINFIVSTPIIITLSFLEICVSIIQAYVLITLLTLYSTEIN